MRCAILLSLALVLASSAAVPAQRAGIVTALRGEVSVQRPGGESRTPGIKEEVFEGDTIKTGSRGRVQVCFEDDSIVSIGRNATLVVTKFFFDPSAKQGAMQIEVKEGFFRVLGGAVTRIAPENFETVAGTASIGIRGCSLGGEVNGGLATLVFFGSNIGGGIEVTGAGVQRFVGTPGNGVVVPPNGPPSVPSPMETFGVRILTETQIDGGTGGGTDPDGGSPTNLPGENEEFFDPTKLLDERVPELLPDGNVLLHGFSIGQELQTGWLYRNGSPELLSLELTTLNGLLQEVVSGKMTVSVHTDADFAFDRTGGFLLPIITFEITNGCFSDGVDLLGNPVVAVTNDNGIVPEHEAKAYMNWGKWSMTIVDPNSVARETEARVVNGLWIATDLERTDLTDFRSETGDMVLGGDFQGTYRGQAQCLRNGTDQFSGTSFFQLNFRDQTFTGQFDFSTTEAPNFTFDGNVNADGSVQGNITSVSGESVNQSQSLIEGALYDKGTVIGTSWNATTETNSYIGVAGGQGTITPIPSGTTNAP
jgi:hypothetical protein